MKIITYLFLISTFLLTSCYTKFAAEGDRNDDYGYRDENDREQMQTPYVDATDDSSYVDSAAYYSQAYDDDELGYDNSSLPQIDINITSDYRPWSLHRSIYIHDYRWRHHVIVDPVIYIDPYYANFYGGYDFYYDPWDSWWSYPGYVVYPGYPSYPYYSYYPNYDPYYSPYYGYWGGGYGGYGRQIFRKTPRSFDDRHPSAPIRRDRRSGRGADNGSGIASRPVYRPVGGNGGSGNRNNNGRGKANRPDRNKRGKRIIHNDDHGSHMSGLASSKPNRPTRTTTPATRRVTKRTNQRHYYNITNPGEKKTRRTVRPGKRAPRKTKYVQPKVNVPKKRYRVRSSAPAARKVKSKQKATRQSRSVKTRTPRKNSKNSVRKSSGNSRKVKRASRPAYHAPRSKSRSSSGSGSSPGYRSTPRSSSSGSSRTNSAPRSSSTPRSHRR